MVSMKTDDSSDCYSSSPNPYGYGLSIRLNDDQVEALGIKTPPPAGTVFMVTARAVATSVTQNVEEAGEADDDTGPDICMELQITDMELKGEGSDPAARLYG